MKFVRTPLFLTTTISSFLSLNVYAFHQFGVSPLELFHPKSEDHARIRRRPILSPTSYLLCPGTARQSSLINDNDIDDGDRPWLTTGLLISSFSDGIKPNPEAQDFLLRGLVKAMLTEKQRKAEISVHNSAIQSPCCGPDIGALNSLETADNALATLIEGQTPSTSTSWNNLVDSLLLDDEGSDELELRFLYIPTAMYALRADSQNTPGKQRQRARADGKKRRNEIVQLIKDKLGEKVSVLAVTLDFDDGSVKQPEGSDDKRRFPTDGKDAIGNWNPHFIYIQGGNTFWLYHCIEKGGWAQDLVAACSGPNAAVYCGTSAGAIIMGDTMETACWKGWDDPSIVPGKGTYADWKGVRGFGMVGNASFFPHMEQQWMRLVAEKQKELASPAKDEVICLRDEDVCCVDGESKSISMFSAQPTMVVQ